MKGNPTDKRYNTAGKVGMCGSFFTTRFHTIRYLCIGQVIVRRASKHVSGAKVEHKCDTVPYPHLTLPTHYTGSIQVATETVTENNDA